MLTVTNDGDTVPPEKLEHLFDRFYRPDEARSDERYHYGLGLSIAKAITKKQSGSITVSCCKGKAQFAVSILIRK